MRSTPLRHAKTIDVMGSAKPLKYFWRDLKITSKFALAFGTLIALIILVAATGYIALTTISNQTESDIVTSMEIQRLVLEIKSGIGQARYLQKSFFLNLPKIGFSKAQKQLSDQVIDQTAVVLERSEDWVRILLAEDNPVNRKLAIMMLGKSGYQVDVAENGIEAVEKYVLGKMN